MIEKITPDSFLKVILCFVGMMIPTVWSLSLAAAAIEKAATNDIEQNSAHAAYDLTINTLQINQAFIKDDLDEIKQMIRAL